MESHGYPMCIHVSQATKELLEDCQEWVPAGQRYIKGKGRMTTYLAKIGDWEEALECSLERTRSTSPRRNMSPVRSPVCAAAAAAAAAYDAASCSLAATASTAACAAAAAAAAAADATGGAQSGAGGGVKLRPPRKYSRTSSRECFSAESWENFASNPQAPDTSMLRVPLPSTEASAAAAAESSRAAMRQMLLEMKDEIQAMQALAGELVQGLNSMQSQCEAARLLSVSSHQAVIARHHDLVEEVGASTPDLCVRSLASLTRPPMKEFQAPVSTAWQDPSFASTPIKNTRVYSLASSTYVDTVPHHPTYNKEESGHGPCERTSHVVEDLSTSRVAHDTIKLTANRATGESEAESCTLESIIKRLAAWKSRDGEVRELVSFLGLEQYIRDLDREEIDSVSPLCAL
mmetsp:Transcript_12645/g.34968  ORF Transcript_12645/g.34968 Transcript_12645/m.34968 type:complete len:404 (-) Transcript_12645:32-1243(-)